MGEEFIEDSIKQTISDDDNLLDATQNAIIDEAENVLLPICLYQVCRVNPSIPKLSFGWQWLLFWQ